MKHIYKKFLQKFSRNNPSFGKTEYLNAYAHQTDSRIDEDPYEAIGGYWDQIGELQFNFITKKGMKPYHRFLDIGCGTLRGGRFAIAYLDPTNYWGFDISKKAIDYAKNYITDNDLVSKKSVIFFNRDNLKSSKLRGIKFDFLLAQSVFTHLPSDCIEDFFTGLQYAMNSKSKFYFTYVKADKFVKRTPTAFAQPDSFYDELAKKNNLKMTNVSVDYNTPRDQQMIEVMLYE